MELTDPAAFAVPSTSAPFSPDSGVTLEAIMAQLQRVDACLGGFSASLSPSLEASTDEDGEDSDDGDDADANSSSDDEMTTS